MLATGERGRRARRPPDLIEPARYGRCVFNIDMGKQRGRLAAWAAHQGFTCVVPENEHTRPMRPAFYFGRHQERPCLVSWSALESRTPREDGGSRKTYTFRVQTYTVAASGPIAYTVSSRTGRRAPTTFDDLALPDRAAAQMPPACQRAFWQLIQPAPRDFAEFARPPGHQLAIVSRSDMDEFLPEGWFETDAVLVNTSCGVSAQVETTSDMIGRALDRAGWMCWSLEYEAELPDDLRV